MGERASQTKIATKHILSDRPRHLTSQSTASLCLVWHCQALMTRLDFCPLQPTHSSNGDVSWSGQTSTRGTPSRNQYQILRHHFGLFIKCECSCVILLPARALVEDITKSISLSFVPRKWFIAQLIVFLINLDLELYRSI